jgi:hypothetical protein
VRPLLLPPGLGAPDFLLLLSSLSSESDPPPMRMSSIFPAMVWSPSLSLTEESEVK